MPRFPSIRLASILGLAAGFAFSVADFRANHIWPREWLVVSLLWALFGGLTAIAVAVLVEVALALQRGQLSSMRPSLKWGFFWVVGMLVGMVFFYWFIKTSPQEHMAAAADGYLGADGTPRVFWSDSLFFLPWMVMGGILGLVARAGWVALGRMTGSPRSPSQKAPKTSQ